MTTSTHDIAAKLGILEMQAKKNAEEHKQILDVISKLVDAINGNGKPGIKSQIAAMKTELWVHRFVIGAVVTAALGLLLKTGLR